jgi:Asp-tRNA(Asn)/Glu-tRNA(Gln) amidotransferase A subunit family amidase
MDPSGERVSAEEAGAFVQRFSVAPTAPGALSGLTFAVKDLIDIAGRKSGCGLESRIAVRVRCTGGRLRGGPV